MKHIKSFVLPLLLLVAVCAGRYIKTRQTEQLLSYQELVDKIDLPKEESKQAGLSNERILKDLAPLIQSNSVDHVAEYIVNLPIPFERKVELISQIVGNDAYSFTRDDDVQLILNVAQHYPADSKEQEQIFDIFLTFPPLLKESYPVLMAVNYHYDAVVLPLITWGHKRAQDEFELKQDLDDIKLRSVARAVEQEDGDALRSIHNLSRGIDRDQATSLVWEIAHTGNSSSMLKVLNEVGADLNAVKEGKTPLIEAVIKRYRSVVQALLDAGVDIDKIVDPEIGSALQQSFEQRDVYIEQMLRQAGAKE